MPLTTRTTALLATYLVLATCGPAEPPAKIPPTGTGQAYLTRSKAAEAVENVGAIVRGAAEASLNQRPGQLIVATSCTFPPAAPCTPGRSACVNGEAKERPVNADDWAHPTWRAVRFQPPSPYRYQYCAEVTHVDGVSTFTAVAIGDLDCDGTTSEYRQSVSGQVRNGKCVTRIGPVEKIRPLE